jgi:hypothetical protein
MEGAERMARRGEREAKGSGERGEARARTRVSAEGDDPTRFQLAKQLHR